MIELKNICKKFGENVVLEGFSLKLSAGDKIALMGASGCGKTTLLHIAAGLTKADSGSVERTGEFALMFQEPRLLSGCNAKENITAILPKDKHELADKYLSAVGLADATDKYPHELSGGMAQRVAFARFLAFAEETDAGILLLDEPFSALDSDTADKMLSLLDKFAESKTLLIVTHDESHAEKLGAKIIGI